MKKILIGALLGFTSLSTFAASNFTGKLSGELQVGQTAQLLDSGGGNAISYGIRGAYNFDKYSGIELAYLYYGSTEFAFPGSTAPSEYVQQRLTPQSVNLGIKGGLPLPMGFSLNARIGVSLWHLGNDGTIVNRTTRVTSSVLSNPDSGINVYFGISGQYNFYDNLYIGLMYEHTEFPIKTDVARQGTVSRLKSGNLILDTPALTLGYIF